MSCRKKSYVNANSKIMGYRFWGGAYRFMGLYLNAATKTYRFTAYETRNLQPYRENS